MAWILLSLNHLIARMLSHSKRCIKFWMLFAKKKVAVDIIDSDALFPI